VNELKNLDSMGLAMPSGAYLAGLILFGVLGWAAYRYGKKTAKPITKWLGVAMMLYPYAIGETWQLYAIGTVLCVGIYVYRQ